MSDTPTGYTLVSGDYSPATARKILAAATAAGIDPGLVKPAPERGGYYVPTAVAAYVATTADPGASFGGDDGVLAAQLRAEVAATYVAFANHDGSPVIGKHVLITLTADGTDIDNIQVVTP